MIVLAALRNMIFAVVFYLGSLPFLTVAFLSIWISPRLLRQTAHYWSLYHHLCARYLLGIKVRVVGNLERGAVLYAIKHESMFETMDLPRMLPQPAVIAKKQLFKIPLWGRAAIAFGMIPVDREGGSRALREMLAGARRAVAAGRPVVIFPEGTRVTHGTQAPLQSGFAGLYKLLNLPVVPVAVDSGKLSPRLNRYWRSGTVTYHVGETIEAGLPREEIEAKVLGAINAINSNSLASDEGG